MSGHLIEAKGLSRYYRISQGVFRPRLELKALDRVSFTLQHNSTLAVVGESGCGKTTLARMLTHIETPTAGELTIDGIDAVNAGRGELRKLRQRVQMVFQDPFSSLNPRKKVGTILGEPLAINTGMKARERAEAARSMMARVGLQPEHYNRYPHMFSGGQRQRIAIARALMLQPKVVVADEPVSALDVSIQAQILNLMMDLQDEFDLAYLFISHDLNVVRHIADDLMVMYLGRSVEQGQKEVVFEKPLHPYTRALLASTPKVNPEDRKIVMQVEGEVASPLNAPQGCAFYKRCHFAKLPCKESRPELQAVEGRLVACHYAGEI